MTITMEVKAYYEYHDVRESVLWRKSKCIMTEVEAYLYMTVVEAYLCMTEVEAYKDGMKAYHDEVKAYHDWNRSVSWPYRKLRVSTEVCMCTYHITIEVDTYPTLIYM